jgi:hypothetical protein
MIRESVAEDGQKPCAIDFGMMIGVWGKGNQSTGE